ncbi:MAG TPA: hypothetical protein VLW50_08385 [Streptosporangiaceae bacterium]|nr:hypothetical protein [Streptosporangiaceae bacterium]
MAHRHDVRNTAQRYVDAAHGRHDPTPPAIAADLYRLTEGAPAGLPF